MRRHGDREGRHDALGRLEQRCRPADRPEVPGPLRRRRAPADARVVPGRSRGNSVDTTGTCGSNLHSAWDTCLLQQAVGTDVAAAVDQLTGEVVRRTHGPGSINARSTGPTNCSRSRSRTQPTTATWRAPPAIRARQRSVRPRRAGAKGYDRRDLHRHEHADHPRSPEAGGRAAGAFVGRGLGAVTCRPTSLALTAARAAISCRSSCWNAFAPETCL